jgi:hypothetical protein
MFEPAFFLNRIGKGLLAFVSKQLPVAGAEMEVLARVVEDVSEAWNGAGSAEERQSELAALARMAGEQIRPRVTWKWRTTTSPADAMAHRPTRRGPECQRLENCPRFRAAVTIT